MKWLSIFFILATATPSLASTGPTGLALGLGTGVEGYDFSDGSNRQNIGGITQQFDIGVHSSDFAFLVNGTFMEIAGTITDYLISADAEVKWYFYDPMFIMATMGQSQFRRTSYNNTVTTVTTDFGGSVGGTLGYDIYSGLAGQPLRVNVNVGAKYYYFGATDVRTGSVVSDTDLQNPINGLTYFFYIGLDWYL